MEARKSLMSRAHGLDKKRRQEKTKVATRASIDQEALAAIAQCSSRINKRRRKRRSHHAVPVEGKKERKGEDAAAATTRAASRTLPFG